MAAVGGSRAIYRFDFTADSGDAWGGWFVAAADAFTAGAELRMPAGAYTVLGQTTDVLEVDLFGLQEGQVFVEWYRDGQSGQFLPTRNGPATPAGTAGLGSELDAAWDGVSWNYFRGGFTMDVHIITPKIFIFYFHSAVNGDTYIGRVVEDRAVYSAGSVIRTDSGVYAITAELPLGVGDSVLTGTVWIDGYHDFSTGRWLDTYQRQVGAASGSHGLGSEQDWAWDGDEWDLFLAGVTQWVRVEWPFG